MQKTLEVEVQALPTKLSPAQARALDRAWKYDWILFTSKNAVSFFSKELQARARQDLSSVRIAAVGPETAAALRAHGFSVDTVPAQFSALDMVQSLGSVDGLRVLFPRSAIAPGEPLQILRAQGARVRVVPLYYPVPVTLSKEAKQSVLSGAYSTLSFKSPSGIKGFLAQLNAVERKAALQIPAVCIGPTTAKAAEEYGFRHVSLAVL